MKASDLSPELADLGIEEVQIARVEPGDVIVLSTSRTITMRDADEIRERCSEFFKGHEVIVLENGITMKIVRKGGEL